jgi:hypothetical protein
MVNPILARLRQHIDAERRGEWNGRRVPGALRPVAAVANAIGLALDPFETAGKAGTGGYYAAMDRLIDTAESPASAGLSAIPGIGPVLAMYGAARQVAEATGHDLPSIRNTREGQSARRAAAALATAEGGPLARLLAANEAAARGNELSVGVANEVINPLNWVGAAGRAGRLLELSGKAPGVGRAVQRAALAGEGLNRASVLPLYLSRKGLERLVARPDWLLDDLPRAAAPVARGVAPAVGELLDNLGAQQAAREAPSLIPKPPMGWQARSPVAVPALAPTKAEYDRAARRAGALPLPKMEQPEPSPLAPSDFNIIRAARENARANRLREQLPLHTESVERAAAGMPTPAPGAASPLLAISPKLADRVAEAMAGRRPVSPPLPPARTPFPRPLSREQRIADRLAQRFAPQGDEAVETVAEEVAPLVPAATRALPGPRTPGALLAERIAQRYGVRAGVEAAGEAAPLVDMPAALPTPDVPAIPLSDRAEQATVLLQEGLRAAYGERASHAFPRLLAKLGARVGRDGTIVREGADITGPVLRYFDDHARLGADRRAIDRRYAQLLGEITPDAPASVGDAAQPEGLAALPRAAATAFPDMPDMPDTPDDFAQTEALRADFREGLAAAIARGSDEEAFAILDLADEFGYPAGEASALYDELRGAGSLVDQQLELIEASPYFSVFKHFNPDGSLKKRNPLTGKPLVVREGGRISKGRAEVWNIPGSGYDEVAAEAMESVGGYNANNAATADDFWTRAQEAFRQYQQLKRGREIAPAAFAGDIAAGGGGGGGLGIAAQLPAPRVAFGAAAGGTAGGVGGYLAPAEDEDERWRNVAAGVLSGTVAGATGGQFAPEIATVVRGSGPQLKQALARAIPEGTLVLDDDILGDVVTAVQRARDAAGQPQPDVPGGVVGFWKKLAGQWSRMTVDTVKQLPQDALYRATVLEGVARKEFPGLSYDFVRRFHKPVSRERATGAVSLDSPYNALLLMTGHADMLARKGDIIGTEFTDAVTGTARFGRAGSTLAGAALSWGAAFKTVNPLAPVFGAVRGAVDLEWSTALRHLIGTANDAFREAMGTLATRQELARVAAPFLDELAARGADVAALRARDGLFAAEEVAATAGPQAAKHWATLSEGAILKAGDRVAFLAGDFRDKTAKEYLKPERTSGGERFLVAAERAVGRVAPFSRWQIRSAPVLAEIARDHPRAAAALAATSFAQAERAKEEKLKPYQAGTVPVGTDDTLLGGLARARLGGVAGTVRANPLSAFVPFGAENLAGEELPADATGYQRAVSVLGRAGFSPNPILQALAYVGGQDYRAPGNLSRTAGIEGLADLGPVLLRAYLRSQGQKGKAEDIPNLAIPSGRALLDAGRTLLAPVTGASVSESTPETRRYAELVLAETGQPLSDPANRRYLERMGDAGEPLWERAVAESRLLAAAGNIVGLASPVQTTAQTAEAVAAQQAGPLPHTSYAISQAPRGQQARMRAENERAAAANPAVATYADISPAARRRQLMAEWEQRNERIKRLAPNVYRERRKRYEESLR